MREGSIQAVGLFSCLHLGRPFGPGMVLAFHAWVVMQCLSNGNWLSWDKHMDPKQWQRVRAILEEALDLPPEEQRAFVVKACHGDETLLADVLGMLDETGADVSHFHEDMVSIMDEVASLQPGTEVGNYRVVRELGHGGMGIVYLAERLDDIHMQVALKIIKRGMDTREIITRFRRERQILAAMKGPYMARFLDGGTTGDGLPYFVMEYIDGERLDHWCAQQDLSLKERLDLFLKVCSAVSSAHQSLIIHRDLKPGNILVTPDGTPKLLDFGIAGLLDAQGHSHATLTQQGMRPMTLAYAAPEQILGEPLNTACDVYALGVILYELLTGFWPYKLHTGSLPAGDIGAQMGPHIQQAVLEKEPVPPSSVVTGKGSVRGDGAARVAYKLRKQLRGDLDKVVLKALARNPAARYSSAEALAEDLGRYLEGLPVRAQRPTFTYRMGKFVRRNWVGLGTLSLVLLMILTFSISTVLQQRKTAQERDTAEAVTRFMVQMFEVVDPSQAQGETITAKEVLDAASQRIEEDLETEPEVRTRLMRSMGKVYQNLALYAQAEQLIIKALEIQQQQYEGPHASVAENLNELAVLRHYQGKYDAAEQTYKEALVMAVATLGEEALLSARIQTDLGSLYYGQKRLEEAETLTRKALTIKERLRPNDYDQLTDERNNLAAILFTTGQYEEAEDLYRQDLKLAEEHLGERHPNILITLNNLAALLYQRGDMDLARPLFERVIRLTRIVKGDAHPDLASALLNLGRINIRQNRGSEAVTAVEEARAIRSYLYGDDHVQTLRAHLLLNNAERRRGNIAQALTHCFDVLTLVRNAQGPDHWLYSLALSNLGYVFAEDNQHLCGPVLEEALQRLHKRWPSGDHWLIGQALFYKGACLRRQEMFAAAECALLEGYQQTRTKPLIQSLVSQELQSLYTQWEKPQKANSWDKVN